MSWDCLSIGSAQKDPAPGHYTFSGITTWKGGARSSTLVRGFTIEADEPVGLPGSNTAPNAVELVLSALGACLTVGVAYAAAQREIEDTITEIRDRRGSGYPWILLATVIETSPVRDIITGNVPVNIQLARPK